MAAARKEKAVTGPGLGVLQSGSVRPATQKNHLKLYREFEKWMGPRMNNLKQDPQMLDLELKEYVEECFLEGENLGWAQHMVAAALYFHPRIGRGIMAQLPQTGQALRGFRRLDPPKARLPWPWPMVALIANGLFLRGAAEAGLAVLLMFELYLRPGEAFNIRGVSVVPDRMETPVVYDIILNPWEAQSASKTNEFDNALRLDLPRHRELGPAMERLLRRRLGPAWRAQQRAVADKDLNQAEKVFRLTPPELTKLVKVVIKENKVKLGDVHLYRVRHSGASHDFVTKSRTLEEVRRRGRWRSFQSLRRYEKGARCSELMERLSEEAHAHAVRCSREIYGVVAGRRFPWAEP